jgi:membrane protein required for colicin V production
MVVMNWLDIVILVVIAISFFAGLKSGIIKTAISLAGMAVGVILAGRYYTQLAPYLSFIPEASVANVVAFIIILLVTMIFAAIIAALLTSFAKAILLGWLNALLGGVFGIFMGMILTASILAIWVKFRGPSSVIEESQLASVIIGYVPFVLDLLPPEFGSIRSFFK